jgi:hypothetical protein
MILVGLLEAMGADFFYTLIEFLYAPFIYPKMLWILIPVLVAIGLMELYFSRYPRDALGHHRFLENTIFLIFITFDIIRHIVLEKSDGLKIFMATLFIVGWIFIACLDFMHMLPTRFHWKIPTKLLIAYSTYVAIVIVYTDILVSTQIYHFISVIFSVILVLLIIIMVRRTFTYIEPKSYEEIEHYLSNIEKEIKETMDKENITQEIK